MAKWARPGVLFAALVLLWPTAAHAQASLAGVVKDASGGVLPGVTVEAASSALIEKVRSVVTDDTGQYRIVDLRPGSYSVTFTLTGFSTVKREGLELAGSGTITVNADLKVGTLAETITVTGETPVVDVQNAARQAVLTGDAVAAAPAARSWNGILLLQPGITGDPGQVQLVPVDDYFRRPWRSDSGGASSRGWDERRRVSRRRRRVRLHGRYGQPPGDHVSKLRRPRRGRNRRPVHERRPEDGRQHVSWLVRRVVLEPVAAGEQLHGRLEGGGPQSAGAAAEALRSRRRARRPDQEGPALVLHDRPLPRQRAIGAGDVRQRQRRQSQRLDATCPNRRCRRAAIRRTGRPACASRSRYRSATS